MRKPVYFELRKRWRRRGPSQDRATLRAREALAAPAPPGGRPLAARLRPGLRRRPPRRRRRQARRRRSPASTRRDRGAAGRREGRRADRGRRRPGAPRIVFFLTAGEAEAAQFEGDGEGAEQIGRRCCSSARQRRPLEEVEVCLRSSRIPRPSHLAALSFAAAARRRRRRRPADEGGREARRTSWSSAAVRSRRRGHGQTRLAAALPRPVRRHRHQQPPVRQRADPRHRSRSRSTSTGRRATRRRTPRSSGCTASPSRSGSKTDFVPSTWRTPSKLGSRVTINYALTPNTCIANPAAGLHARHARRPARRRGRALAAQEAITSASIPTRIASAASQPGGHATLVGAALRGYQHSSNPLPSTSATSSPSPTAFPTGSSPRRTPGRSSTRRDDNVSPLVADARRTRS